MFHRCYECPALHSQEVRVAARSVVSQYREQFAHGIFPDPGAILPTGFPERACQVLWHNRHPDGLLEGHSFTDGSSSGNGALRRAGWAAVAVDDAGNLKAAAYGAVPSDILPGHLARDGEDYAAAMAEQFTLDPLTLYIDCEGTIATINGPKHKALGARGQGSQGQGSCHRERRGGWANFPLVQKGQRPCRHLRKKRGRYTQARFSSRQDSCCLFVLGQASGTLGGRSARLAQVQGVERHQCCRATIKGTAPASETQAKAGEGDCCDGYRSGFRLAFSHVSLTFLARQSPRPSHIQRAQLAIGTSFRCWWPSFGQRYHLLRQVWSGLLGACGCALPPMQRIPKGQSVAAAKIEVGALPEQTLPGLDVRRKKYKV